MRRSRQKKAALIRLGTTAVCLLISLLFSGILHAIRCDQQSQLAAERWQGKSDQAFTQISVFLSSDAAFTSPQAESLDAAIQTALDGISCTDLWYSCTSTETSLTLTSDYGRLQARATAVSGDFFLMRNFRYLGGSGFAEDDFDPNRVVLDHTAAWQLFGSYDVAGQIVRLGELELTVAGVVDSRHTGLFDRTEEKAYGDRPRIYLPYSILLKQDQTAVFSCYEAVIPEPIGSFAVNTVKDNLPIDPAEAEIQVNTGRYSFIPLFSSIGGLWIRSMRTSRIIYPWWENTAGVAEDCAALCQLGMVIFAGTALILLLYAGIRLLHRHPLTLRPLLNVLDQLHDRKLRRDWEKKQAVQKTEKE